MKKFKPFWTALFLLLSLGCTSAMADRIKDLTTVAGIIRPDDVAPNNTVQSRRLANAQISYRGTGDLANATRAGWGTSAVLKLWPF